MPTHNSNFINPFLIISPYVLINWNFWIIQRRKWRFNNIIRLCTLYDIRRWYCTTKYSIKLPIFAIKTKISKNKFIKFFDHLHATNSTTQVTWVREFFEIFRKLLFVVLLSVGACLGVHRENWQKNVQESFYVWYVLFTR